MGCKTLKTLLSPRRDHAYLAVLLVVSVSFFYFHLYDYLNINTIKQYQSVALHWTASHYAYAASLYILIYVLLIACAIPCATFFTLLGGVLFGAWAILYAEFSTTLGGMILFLTIRSSLGTRIAAKSTGWIKKVEQGFQKNAFNYLLSLRLMPIFPCWVSNIAAGLLNVPLATFLWATLLGILPATVIYVMVGRGLEKILADDSAHVLNVILTPSVMLPLLGLAIFSLIPVIYKSVKKSD